MNKRVEEPAYTPRTEYLCKESDTHYLGCQCHEARHAKEISDLKSRLAIAIEALERLSKYYDGRDPESCVARASISSKALREIEKRRDHEAAE